MLTTTIHPAFTTHGCNIFNLTFRLDRTRHTGAACQVRPMRRRFSPHSHSTPFRRGAELRTKNSENKQKQFYFYVFFHRTEAAERWQRVCRGTLIMQRIYSLLTLSSAAAPKHTHTHVYCEKSSVLLSGGEEKVDGIFLFCCIIWIKTR